MIEYALLIMLGFCLGGLIAFLLAPTLWHRAVRLTTRRLEATMPMSLSEIEADKDLLRASYAIRIRRLEASLNNAREKSANQLVDISKLQMQISELKANIADLDGQLEERRNAANVFESTIRKRFPELEHMVAVAKAALDDREQEVVELTSKLRRREETLEQTQRSAALQQDEIRELRETLEKRGADTTGRFRRRASQWTLEEYRSEYDRLNVELSKMREQLIVGQERERRQISVLKSELQQLGERIMSSAMAQERRASDWRSVEDESSAQPGRPTTRPPAAAPQWRGGVRPANRAQPWPVGPEKKPERNKSDLSSADGPVRELKDAESSSHLQTGPNQDGQQTVQIAPPFPIAAPADDALVQDQPMIAGSEEAAAKQADRDELRALLDRNARKFGGDLLESEEPSDGSLKDRGERGPAASGNSLIATPATRDKAAAPSQPQTRTSEIIPSNAQAAGPEPKLDQVFREILDSRPQSPEKPTESASNGNEPPVENEAADYEAEPVTDETGDPQKSGASKTQTLLDRLRVMQERQTG